MALVFRASFRGAMPYIRELHTPEEDLEYFSNVVFETNQVFVACNTVDQRMIGFIAFDDAMVNHLYLLPESSGRGIGGELLQLAKQGRGTLRLWAFQRNEMAKKFYIKHNFRVIKQTDGADNEAKEPDILFEWSADHV